VRSFALTLALVACGCGEQTVLRISVEPGVTPPPASLRITLAGAGLSAPTRTFAPVTFPATLVVHGLSDDVSELCVEAEGLDGAGNFLVGGSATAQLVAHRTTRLEVQMSNAFVRCPSLADDLGANGAADLGTSDGAQPPHDGAVALCPPGALFCDDFESGTLAGWSQRNTKYDLGSLDVQTATVAHGLSALHAAATGTTSMSNIAELEYDFAPRPPPLAIRANVYAPMPLTNYTMVMALYDPTTRGFSIGGDGDATWVVTEDDATGPDHHSDLVPITGGQWHCLEIVVDAAGQVSAFVDDHALVGPFARKSSVAYSAFLVGVDRTVFADTNVFVDDVALGPSRLYCPK
jgi:hypothetical protein